jgi:hypothetical protein
LLARCDGSPGAHSPSFFGQLWTRVAVIAARRNLPRHSLTWTRTLLYSKDSSENVTFMLQAPFTTEKRSTELGHLGQITEEGLGVPLRDRRLPDGLSLPIQRSNRPLITVRPIGRTGAFVFKCSRTHRPSTAIRDAAATVPVGNIQVP